MRRYIVGPGEDEGDWKTDKQKHDHETQRPVWQFPGRKHRRTDLNNESRSDDVSGRDPIDLSTLQLFEETAHNEISARLDNTPTIIA